VLIAPCGTGTLAGDERRSGFCGTGTLAGDERCLVFVAPALLPVIKDVWFLRRWQLLAGNLDKGLLWLNAEC
jgi:hypothetical protein